MKAVSRLTSGPSGPASPSSAALSASAPAVAGRPAAKAPARPGPPAYARYQAARAVALYLVVAAVGFTVMLLVSRHFGRAPEVVLRRWDSGHYLHIAQHGYPGEIPYGPDGEPKFSRLAFFPLVPALIRAVHLVTGLPVVWAGVVVSWTAASVAAAGVFRLVRAVGGRPGAGYACVALWACSPYAFALWVPYSEAVFSAALIWTLLAVLERRWLPAAALCVLAGAVRPSASVVVGTVGLAAGWELVQQRGSRRAWRAWTALLTAPLGIVASWLFLGSKVGRVDGWFEAERAWGQSFDFGAGTAHVLKDMLLYRHAGRMADLRTAAVIAVLVLGAVGVWALARDRRVPWPLVATVALAWVLIVGTPGSPLSKPRFMLPFLPVLLLLAARPLARAPLGVRVCLYGGGAVVSGWYAAGLLVLFEGSP
ncbi:DUF2079 domain-containing protein [Streptomyces roseoverticillatus]|uniref:DUF2079 domain-containing protein n=1 Tax=Streptomyces roseoverticillatus TaxID=66429 RepID=UPI001F28044B|nr:DUF2079 domain-containing protein [Streptomyces roseoverticillatus]MCF3104539.1 DUF2079 domain-containing protein [Streptomyces roseoverticillatus]